MSLNQVPPFGKNTNEQKLIDTVNQLILGNANNTGEVTLTENATTTTVKNSRINANTFIDFMPLTANAASEKAAGTMYITSANIKSGEFTITHANNAQTDRTFRYLHVG